MDQPPSDGDEHGWAGGIPCRPERLGRLQPSILKILIYTANCRIFLGEDKTMTASISTARLEARISPDLHAMLKRVAELQGRTMTDFVVAAVQEAAYRALEQSEVIRLSLADQECFAHALMSPPQPSPALKRAFARRRKLLRSE